MGIIGSVKKAKDNFSKWLLYGSKRNSETYMKYLRNRGVQIGEGTVFYDPPTTVVDVQNPSLLKIGKNVRITSGVTILTHDYSWSVMAGVYGECIGNVAPVIIGDNVFIGMKVIVLNGVKIGDNCIIGAGSVVTQNVENNSVYAGVPAKKIMSLEDYYKKRKTKSIDEAKTILCHLEGKSLSEKVDGLREYSLLFEDFRDDKCQLLMRETGYFEKCQNYYGNNSRVFRNIDELRGTNLDM